MVRLVHDVGDGVDEGDRGLEAPEAEALRDRRAVALPAFQARERLAERRLLEELLVVRDRRAGHAATVAAAASRRWMRAKPIPNTTPPAMYITAPTSSGRPKTPAASSEPAANGPAAFASPQTANPAPTAVARSSGTVARSE